MTRVQKLLAASLVAGPLTALSDGLPGPTLRLRPNRIEMTSFYTGATLRVDGEVSKGSGVVVVVRGAGKDEVFNKKARFGVVWASAGKVRISGTPSLFLSFSSKPVRELLSPEAIRKRQLDEDSIKAAIRFDPEQDDRGTEDLRSDYLTRKREDALYEMMPGTIAVQETNHSALFSLEFPWPKKAPPAPYTVSLLECREGQVVGESSVRLEVVKIGFPAKMALVANEHASLYGLLAIVIAAAAGFGIDYAVSKVFGRKARTAH